MIDGTEGKLSDLKAGMRVTLRDLPKALQAPRRFPRHESVFFLLGQCLQELASWGSAKVFKHFQHAAAAKALSLDVAEDFFQVLANFERSRELERVAHQGFMAGREPLQLLECGFAGSVLVA